MAAHATYVEVFGSCVVRTEVFAFPDSFWVIPGYAVIENDVAEGEHAGHVQSWVPFHIVVVAQFLE